MTKPKSQDEFVLTEAQALLGIHLKEIKVGFLREQRFCEREWRLDMTMPDYRLAVEISGGNWSGGHRRGKAQEDEYEKINRAQMLGWRVLQFTNAQVLDGRALMFIKVWLGLDR